MQSESSSTNNSNITFESLVDIERLQKIFEKFSAATGFSTGLASHPDQTPLIQTGWSDICSIYHRANPESEKHCKASNTALTANLTQLKEQNISVCENGLVDGATPVIVKGMHLANIFTGQVFFEKPDIKRFRKQAAQYGFDEDTYIRLLKDVPVVSEEAFKETLKFISDIAVMLAEQGLMRWQERKNEQRIRDQRDLARKLAGVKDLNEILDLCLNASIQMADGDSGGIYLIDETTGDVELEYSVGLSDEFTESAKHFDADSNNAKVVHSGQPAYFSSDIIEQVLVDTKRKEGLKCLAILPVSVEGRVIACINIASHSNKEIALDIRDILETSIYNIGSVIGRAISRESLEKSDAQFRVIFDEAIGFLGLMNPEGILLRANKTALEFVDKKESELIGLPFWETVWWKDSEEQREKLKEAIRKAAAGESVRFDAEHVTPDGPQYFVDFSLKPVKDSSGKVILLIPEGRDITEQKKASEALWENETRFRLASECTSDLIYEWDIKTDTLEWFGDIDTAFGYEPGEFIRDIKTWLSHIHPDDKERLAEAVKRHRETGEDINIEYRIVKKDGSIRYWLDNGKAVYDRNGTLVKLIGACNDITDRKLAEEETKKLATVVRHSSELVILATLDGKMIFLNEAGSKMLGIDIDNVESANIMEVITDQFKDLVENALLPTLIDSGYWDGELQYKNLKTGKLTDVHAITFLIRDPNTGKPLYLANTSRDITDRKIAEEHLKESESKLNSIFQAAPIGIGVVKNRIIGWTNDTMSQLLGYTFDELKDMLARTLYETDEEYERVGRVKHADVAKYGVGSIETRFKCKDNRVIDILLSSAAINPDDPAAGMIFTVMDISDRKRAEKALEKSEIALRTIFNNNHDAIFLHAVDGKIINVNEKMLEMYRVEKDQALTLSIVDDFTSPDWDSAHIAAVWKKAIKGEAQLFEWKARRPNDSSVFDVEVALRLVHINDEPLILANVRDITDRKQSEKALAEEKERLAVTLSSIGDAVIATDTSGNVVLFNRVAEELTSWKADDAFGQPLEEVFNIINEKTRNRCENPVNLVLRSDRTVGLANHTILIAKDGTERAIADSGAPIRSSEGEIIGVVLVFRDVTEANKLQELSIRAQRLETAGRIAGQVAHDFNNLLSPLTAYPDLIRDELSDNHPVMRFVDEMENAAERISIINQQLLTLGRRGHYSMVPMKLNNTISQVLREFMPFPTTVIVNTFFAENLMHIKGGEAQVFRVLSNLVNNAIDAMQEVGELTIKTANYYADRPSGKHVLIPVGEYVKITISDTGCGMSEEILPKIFDPFYSTKTAERRRGSGLGLSIVHTVVEDHDGYIDFESIVGQGTSFYLYFPVTRDRIIPDDSDVIIPSGIEKILIVDDDALQRNVCRTLLKRQGYEVDTIDSGEKAVETIREKEYDLVILDMIMPPGIDGAETFRLMLEINPDQRAIIVSGFAQSERVADVQAMGAGEFIKKPLSLRVIAAAVRKEIDRKIPYRKKPASL